MIGNDFVGVLIILYLFIGRTRNKVCISSILV